CEQRPGQRQPRATLERRGDDRQVINRIVTAVDSDFVGVIEKQGCQQNLKQDDVEDASFGEVGDQLCLQHLHNADGEENYLLVPFELRGKRGQSGEEEQPDDKPDRIETAKPPGLGIEDGGRRCHAASIQPQKGPRRQLDGNFLRCSRRERRGSVQPRTTNLRDAALPVRVVSVSGLHAQVFPFHLQLNVMITSGCAVFIGRVAHVVLGTQFFDNAVVDLAHGLLFRDFKETSAGFFGNALENLLAIGVLFFGMTLATSAATTTAARISASATGPATTSAGPTAAAPARSAAAAHSAWSFAFFTARICEIYGVDNRVGALGRLDRTIQVSLAAAVNSVRQNNERLPPLLFLH